MQECLMRAFRSFDSLSAPEAGGRWLQTILVNTFRDGLRKDARRVEEVPVEDIDDFSLYRTIADEDPLPYSDSLHLDFLLSFGREDVYEVLKRMPKIYRVPLVLRYIHGFATKEVARMLHAPLGTGARSSAPRAEALRARAVDLRARKSSAARGVGRDERARRTRCSEAVRQLWHYLDTSFRPRTRPR